jgi:hypothetical protein
MRQQDTLLSIQPIERLFSPRSKAFERGLDVRRRHVFFGNRVNDLRERNRVESRHAGYISVAM